MRLLAQVVAERIADRMVANFGELDQRVIADIAQQRDQLLASANKVIVFLFTTITIIAIVLFGAAEEKVPFFGITITQPDVFAFIGFMVGNVAYVVSTGLFFKLFVCEFLILCITKSPIYSDNRDIGAFVHCYHANSLSYLVLYDLVPERMWVLRRFLAIINLYSKY